MQNHQTPFGNLVAVVGAFGSGKSLFMTEYGVYLANKFKKKLVLNYYINEKALKKYCANSGLDWFAKFGRVVSINLKTDGINSMFISHSVVVVDELGAWLNSRFWKTRSQDFLEQLFQIRHLNIHLIGGYQFANQVDVQFRNVCQHFCVCKGISKPYDERLKGPKLRIRFVYHYSLEMFEKLDQSKSDKVKPIGPWRSAASVYYSFLPFNRFSTELANVIKIFYSSFKGKVVKQTDLKLSKEDMLFKCFQSIGSLVGSEKRGKKTISNIVPIQEASRRVIDVTDLF